MRRAWLAGLAWLLGVAGSPAETLRIATYNVENYGAADRMVAAGYRRDYPKPEAAKAALRAVIRAIAADLLILQEMGGPAYLEELRRDLRAEGLDYAFGHVVDGDDENRHLAVLARRPPRAVKPHADLTFRYLGGEGRLKRGLLEVTLATPAGDITVWGVHLKSRFTDRADDPMSATRRAGEATAIRDLILRRHPVPGAARFVILGDFNDGPNSQAVRFTGRRGKTTIADLLPASDSRGETWTYAYRKEDTYQRVDHILVSPGLQPLVADGKAAICDVPETMSASDHRPVVVTLRLP